MRQLERPKAPEFWDELRKAATRIGEGEQQIRWLIDFSQMNLPALSAGSLLNLRFEVLAFSGKGTVPSMGQDLVPFKAEVQAMLDTVLDQRLLAFEFHRFGLRLMPASEDPRTPWEREPFSEHPETIRSYRVFELLARYAHLIRRCPRCTVRFLADRKNQDFCSRRCQTQTATHSYRLRKGQITGRPRGRPRKEAITPRKRKPVTKARRTKKRRRT